MSPERTFELTEEDIRRLEHLAAQLKVLEDLHLHERMNRFEVTLNSLENTIQRVTAIYAEMYNDMATIKEWRAMVRGWTVAVAAITAVVTAVIIQVAGRVVASMLTK